MCSREKDADILALIERLRAEIKVARRHSLGHTVRLLHIAILDLQMVLHSISDDELRQFVEAIDEGLELEKAPRLYDA